MTSKYSKLAFEDGRQIDAMLLLDQSWRRRNTVHLVKSLPVAESLEHLVVEYPKLERLKFDYLPSGLIKAVSAELAAFLTTRIHAEFIPIEGMHAGKQYLDRQFYIMHLLDRFAAVDLGESEYTEHAPEAGGGIDRIEKLVLDISKIGGSSAFVLDELSLVCFRDDICRAVFDEGFKGLRFIPLEKYQNTRLE